MKKRDLLTSGDLGSQELDNLLDLAARMKGRHPGSLLAGKTLALLFFDRSLRTRVSFEVAMVQLGGHCIVISPEREMYDLEPTEQAVMDGRAEEHVKDAARTLSRYVDFLGIRQVAKSGPWERDRRDLLLRAYAQHASVPVINLESASEHPCQALADVLTMRENLQRLRGRKLVLAWANHPESRSPGASHSVLTLAATLGMDVTIAHPLGFELDEAVVQTARQRAGDSGGKVQIVNDLDAAMQGADVVYSRSWGCLKHWGDAEREAMLKRALQAWRIDRELMARTKDALFMHPLPVRRNVAVTDEVLDGPRSVVYDQAANRVHVQKALLAWLGQ
ncbi:MAG: N-acetylornithine carbamoyltransferase [Planctomycetes bacterium]|nr:N-acetylornithine carbamoyltransferase [Planctomycetota bacterium]